VTSFSNPFPRARDASEGTLPAVRSVATASPLEATLHVLDGRWKALLVWQLFWDARPFCELIRRMPGITKKCLRRELAEMERHGLVCRTVRREGSTAYALTPLGETLKPIVGGMYEWGRQAGRGSGGVVKGARRTEGLSGRYAPGSSVRFSAVTDRMKIRKLSRCSRSRALQSAVARSKASQAQTSPTSRERPVVDPLSARVRIR